MTRSEIIKSITDQTSRLGETMILADRFAHNPLKASMFYAQIVMNRYTPFLRPIAARTIWGAPLEAYESSAIGSIYFLGFYDIDITLFLLKKFHETGDILDIGSNIGYYALLGAVIAAPEARVIAFEPTPSTYRQLVKNTAPEKTITTLSIALAETSGTITFSDYGERYAVFNSTKPQQLAFLQNKDTKIQVTTTTLDTICTDMNLTPSLLKLDTEGTEAGILRSGSTVLSKYQPVILLEASGGEALRENTQACLDILESHDYHFFEATTEGELTPHTRKAEYVYQNLICIPATKIHLYV